MMKRLIDAERKDRDEKIDRFQTSTIILFKYVRLHEGGVSIEKITLGQNTDHLIAAVVHFLPRLERRTYLQTIGKPWYALCLLIFPTFSFLRQV